MMVRHQVMMGWCLQHAGTGSAAAQAVLSDYILYLLDAKNAAVDSLSGKHVSAAASAPPAKASLINLLHDTIDAVPATASKLYMHCMESASARQAKITSRHKNCSASTAACLDNSAPKVRAPKFSSLTGVIYILPRPCASALQCNCETSLVAGGLAAWGQLDKAAVETCICAVALALSVVMAGSGHLQTMRLIRGAQTHLASMLFPLWLQPWLAGIHQWLLWCQTCVLADAVP